MSTVDWAKGGNSASTKERQKQAFDKTRIPYIRSFPPPLVRIKLCLIWFSDSPAISMHLTRNFNALKPPSSGQTTGTLAQRLYGAQFCHGEGGLDILIDLIAVETKDL